MTAGFSEQRDYAVAKISGDMMSLCYNTISDETVKSVKKSFNEYLDFQ